MNATSILYFLNTENYLDKNVKEILDYIIKTDLSNYVKSYVIRPNYYSDFYVGELNNDRCKEITIVTDKGPYFSVYRVTAEALCGILNELVIDLINCNRDDLYLNNYYTNLDEQYIIDAAVRYKRYVKINKLKELIKN
jgi:hypothetical protein